MNIIRHICKEKSRILDNRFINYKNIRYFSNNPHILLLVKNSESLFIHKIENE